MYIVYRDQRNEVFVKHCDCEKYILELYSELLPLKRSEFKFKKFKEVYTPNICSKASIRQG